VLFASEASLFLLGPGPVGLDGLPVLLPCVLRCMWDGSGLCAIGCIRELLGGQVGVKRTAVRDES
jgi:hypothetical protein